MVGICSDGSLIKTLAIVKGVTVHTELECLGLLSKYLIIYSQTHGYMTNNLFRMYLHDVFIPEVEKRRIALDRPNATAGLMMDGLQAHTTQDVASILKEKNIETFFLPPHSSHITQPLDRYRQDY